MALHEKSPYIGAPEEVLYGTAFESYMQQIPAYIHRDKDGKAEVIISPGNAIMRGTVIKIFVTDMWAKEGASLDESINAVFEIGKTKKSLPKIREICMQLRKLAKEEFKSRRELEDLQMKNGPFDGLLNRDNWKKFLDETGLPADAWSGRRADLPKDRTFFGSARSQLAPAYRDRNVTGPTTAMAWGLANLPENASLWNELINQQVPEEDTINGITTRGNVAVGALQDDDREHLNDAQRTELATREGAITDAFLEGTSFSEDAEMRAQDQEQASKFRTQCLLAAKAHDRARHNKTVRTNSIPRYNKVMLLDGPPFQLVNKLTYKQGAEKFAKITVPEASSLVPMIKLSKIYYDEAGRPAGEKKITFDTYTRTEDLLSADSGGRSGVGIKSFEWQLNGTNIATVQSDITATLVLYFNNFNDLLKENDKGFKYVDLLVRQDSMSGEDQPTSTKESEAIQEVKVSNDQKHYEIKAEVGWAYNNDYILDYEKNHLLEKALKSQRLTLFLTLVEHEFDLSQDGTFSLTINYRARMDGIFMDKRADVIISEEEKEELCEKTKLLDDYLEKCMKRKATETKEEIADIKLKYIFDSSKYIFNKLLTDSKILYGKLKKETLKKYNFNVWEIPDTELDFNVSITDTSTLLARMNLLATQDYGNDLKEVLHNEGTITVDTANCLPEGLGQSNVVFDTFSTVWNNPSTAAGIVTGVVARGTNYWTGLELGYGNNDRTKEGYEASCFEMGARMGQGTTKNVENISAVDNGYEKIGLYKAPNDDEGPLLIPYFYLGDLIDIVVEKALGSENQRAEGSCNTFINPARIKNMRILLGSLSVPRITETSKNGTTVQTTDFDLINIADIPVAVEYFRDFWERRVTQQKRTTYPLNDFIKDCLKDFALRALGDECFDGERVQDLMIKDVTLSLPSLQSGAEPIKQRIFETKPNVDTSKLASCRLDMNKVSRPFNKPTLASSATKDDYHYKLYYLQNKSASNLTGRPSEDLKNGIIHLNMGEDRGLLKNISFKRAQFPGLRETRVVEQDSFNPLSHLADVYNIDITMFGNTIFWPGQYVYINPIGFGTKLGKPSNRMSPSRAMGIGGYHLITQVSSFIENGKFETTVEALWETSGGPGAQRNNRGQSTGVTECKPEAEDNASSTSIPEMQSNLGKNIDDQ